MVIVPTGEPDDKDFFPKPLFNGSIYIFTKVLMNFGKLINPGLIMWLLSTGFLEVLRRDLPGNLLRDIVTKLSQQRWLKTID